MSLRLAVALLLVGCGDDAAPMLDAGDADVPDTSMDAPRARATLEFRMPDQGATLEGEVTVQLLAMPSRGLETIRIWSGDQAIETAASTFDGGGFSARIDTRELPDGPAVLRAEAEYQDGTRAIAVRGVTIDNIGPAARFVTPVESEAFYREDGPISIGLLVETRGAGLASVKIEADDQPVFMTSSPARGELFALVEPRAFTPEVDLTAPGAYAATIRLVVTAIDTEGNEGRATREVPIRTRIQWEFAGMGNIDSAPVALPAGGVAFGTLSGRLFVVNADGSLRGGCPFVASGENVLSGPVLMTDGVNVVWGTTQHLRATNTNNCTTSWTHVAAEQWWGEPAISPDGTRIYAGTFSGRLYAMGPGGGAIWNVDLGTMLAAPTTVEIQGGAAVGADGAVYQGVTQSGSGLDGGVVAVNADGTRRWAFEGVSVKGNVFVAGDRVYFGGSDGRLYGLDAMTGDRVWASEPRLNEGRPVLCAPRLLPTGDIVACDRGGLIHAVDPVTGDIRWTYDAVEHAGEGVAVDSFSQGGMTVSDGLAFAGDILGIVHAVDPQGESRWTFELPEEIRARPAASPGVLYVGCANQRLYGFSTRRRP